MSTGGIPVHAYLDSGKIGYHPTSPVFSAHGVRSVLGKSTQSTTGVQTVYSCAT